MLQVIKTKNEILNVRKELSPDIGLVPTMGHLHQGHLSLIQESLSNHETTIITIFVNPKQFGPKEDYSDYPRTLEEDVEKIKKLPLRDSQTIIVFAPQSVEEIYPLGFQTLIHLPKASQILCGKTRPVHFSGVTTVVFKLLQISKPKAAYFGKKDFQQLFLIKQMVNDLEVPVEIKGLPLVRDEHGLALSSRNSFLTTHEKIEARKLYKILNDLSQTLNKEGTEKMHLSIQKIRHESELKLDYLEARDADNLNEISSNTKVVSLFIAAFIGKTRLIDNLQVELNK